MGYCSHTAQDMSFNHQILIYTAKDLFLGIGTMIGGINRNLWRNKHENKKKENRSIWAEDRRFRYLNAKHEVSEWMEVHKLQDLLELIDELNNGEDFNNYFESARRFLTEDNDNEKIIS